MNARNNRTTAERQQGDGYDLPLDLQQAGATEPARFWFRTPEDRDSFRTIFEALPHSATITYPDLARPHLRGDIAQTLINGIAAKWTEPIWDLWFSFAADWKDVKISQANYFTPRPFRNEYDRGDTKTGFTYVLQPGNRVCYYHFEQCSPLLKEAIRRQWKALQIIAQMTDGQREALARWLDSLPEREKDPLAPQETP